MEFQNIFSKTKIKEKEKPKITVDHREKNSLLPIMLESNGLEVEFQELKTGDYIVGEVIIERKTVDDFINSIINKRMLRQIKKLESYEKKIILIEGIEEKELYNDYGKPRLNANAIRGFILSLILKYKIPIILTKNAEDSAKFIEVLSRKKEKENSINHKIKTKSKTERIESIIESFPGIGNKTAKKLIECFGSIKNIINTYEEELKKTLGKKTESFINLIHEEVKSNQEEK